MVPGIKLDKGYDKAGLPGTATGPLGHPETWCKGIDDLEKRAADVRAHAQLCMCSCLHDDGNGIGQQQQPSSSLRRKRVASQSWCMLTPTVRALFV